MRDVFSKQTLSAHPEHGTLQLSAVNSDHYRKVMQFQVRWIQLSSEEHSHLVDDQILVYTPEIDPNIDRCNREADDCHPLLTDEPI